MDGEDTYAFHFPAGDGLAAQGLVPIADEVGEVGRMVLQETGHGVEEGEQVSVLSLYPVQRQE